MDELAEMGLADYDDGLPNGGLQPPSIPTTDQKEWQAGAGHWAIIIGIAVGGWWFFSRGSGTARGSSNSGPSGGKMAQDAEELRRRRLEALSKSSSVAANAATDNAGLRHRPGATDSNDERIVSNDERRAMRTSGASEADAEETKPVILEKVVDCSNTDSAEIGPAVSARGETLSSSAVADDTKDASPSEVPESTANVASPDSPAAAAADHIVELDLTAGEIVK
jgi:hypothetical protein